MVPCFKDLLSELVFCIAFVDEVGAINRMIHAVLVLVAPGPLGPGYDR